MVIAALQPVDELVDGPRLIAAEIEVGDEVEPIVERTGSLPPIPSMVYPRDRSRWPTTCWPLMFDVEGR